MTRTPTSRRTPPISLAVALALAGAAGAQDPDDPSFASYRAHVSAAAMAFELGRPDADAWLAGAPPEHRGWEWRYLTGIRDASLSTVAAHDGEIFSADVSPDGRLLATAGADGAVHLWRLPDLVNVGSLSGHQEAVYSVDFSPDGSRLVTASRDRTSRVWDLQTRAEISRLTQDRTALVAAGFAPDGGVATCTWTLADGGVRGMVRLWDPDTGQIAEEVFAGTHPLSSVAFTSEGGLVVGTWEFDVFVFDREPLRQRATLSSPDLGAYRAVDALDVHGSLIAGACRDGVARIWDLESGRMLEVLQGHTASVNGVAFSPDARFLATAGNDTVIRIWDTSTWSEIVALRDHRTGVRDVGWSPDGTRLYSVASDGSLAQWSTDWGRYGPRELVVEGMFSYGATFSADGRWLAMAVYPDAEELQGGIHVWDSHGGSTVASWNAHPGSTCHRVAFAGTGSRLVSCSRDGTTRVWDAATRELVAEQDHGMDVFECDLSPDGNTVAAALDTRQGTIQLWNVQAPGDGVRTLAGHGARVLTVRFSRDGRFLVSGSEAGRMRIWEVSNGDVVARLDGHRGAVSAVVMSPDGSSVASSAADGTVRLWDVATGRGRILMETDEDIRALAFHPDGSRIAAGAGVISLLSPDHAGVIVTLRPHVGAVADLAFSPDGERLVSTSNRGEQVIYDARPLREQVRDR